MKHETSNFIRGLSKNQKRTFLSLAKQQAQLNRAYIQINYPGAGIVETGEFLLRIDDALDQMVDFFTNDNLAINCHTLRMFLDLEIPDTKKYLAQFDQGEQPNE